jgi:nucleoside-diphosphate-sugar epimerase
VLIGMAPAWSCRDLVHIEDAASATVAALESEAAGVFNVVDDEPAPVADWLPALAAAVGAKPPLRVPAILGRLFLPEHLLVMMTAIHPRRFERQVQAHLRLAARMADMARGLATRLDLRNSGMNSCRARSGRVE